MDNCWDDASKGESTSTKILGYDVYFPEGKKPFSSQLAVMSKALQAMRTSSTALLESPTGTGKTLALLCSALSWQRPFRAAAAKYESALKAYKLQSAIQYEGENGPVALTKPTGRKPKVPPIFFASRTHTQISQAVAELKRCPNEYLKDYGGLKMTILSGRKHACTHPMSTKSRNIDDDCRKLHAAKPGGACTFEAKARLTQTALHGVWDLEDLVRAGKATGGCGYYASRGDQQAKAHIIFCPYNYLVDASIRRSLGIDLKGAVVIFDEAHNIEDVAREAASSELSADVLKVAAAELNAFSSALRLREVSEKGFIRRGGWDEVGHSSVDSTVKTISRASAADPTDKINDPAASAQCLGNTVLALIGWLEAGMMVPVDCCETNQAEALESPKTQWISTSEFVNSGFGEESMHIRGVAAWIAIKEWMKRTESSGALELNDCNLSTTLEAMLHSIFATGGDGENEMLLNTNDEEMGAYAKSLGLFDNGGPEILSSPTRHTLTSLVAAFGFMANESNLPSYRVVLKRNHANSHEMRGSSHSDQKTEKKLKLCIWCLTGAVAFASLLEQAHSVLLTSGTLSPLDSFAVELGLDPPPIRLEAGHVVDLSSQVIFALLSSHIKHINQSTVYSHRLSEVFATSVSACSGVSLRCTFESQSNIAYQDALGAMLLHVCSVTPGGVLMFFPSYGLMARLQARWGSTGLTSKIEKWKPIFAEPKASEGGGDALDIALNGYLAQIRSGDSWEGNMCGVSTSLPTRNGAVLLAVCRGKVSEGIDFSDDAARAVIVVGIPYPAYKDLKVTLKREFQTSVCRERRDMDEAIAARPVEDRAGGFLLESVPHSLDIALSCSVTVLNSTTYLDGDAWYRQQAFRALNQAIGRCIRHRGDFGAIFLVDPRFDQRDNVESLSRWLRPHVRSCPSMDALIPDLQSFFAANGPRRIRLSPSESTPPTDCKRRNITKTTKDKESSRRKPHRQKSSSTLKNGVHKSDDSSDESLTLTQFFKPSSESAILSNKRAHNLRLEGIFNVQSGTSERPSRDGNRKISKNAKLDKAKCVRKENNSSISRMVDGPVIATSQEIIWLSENVVETSSYGGFTCSVQSTFQTTNSNECNMIKVLPAASLDRKRPPPIVLEVSQLFPVDLDSHIEGHRKEETYRDGSIDNDDHDDDDDFLPVRKRLRPANAAEIKRFRV